MVKMKLGLGLGFHRQDAPRAPYTPSGQWMYHTLVTKDWVEQDGKEWDDLGDSYQIETSQMLDPSWIIKFHGFNLNIPPGATINQVAVLFDIYVNHISHYLFAILGNGPVSEPVFEGAMTGVNELGENEWITIDFDEMNFGSEERPFTPALANNAEFGVGLWVEDPNTAEYTLTIPGLTADNHEDTVQIAVYYTL